MEGIHASIKAEVLGHWMGIPITNTLVMSWLVVLVLAIFALTMSRRLSLFPGKFQLMIEMLAGGVMEFMETTLESRARAKRYFPLILTMFLFIFIANLFEFVPGVGSIGLVSGESHETAMTVSHTKGEAGEDAEPTHVGEGDHGAFIPLFRSMNTDLNMTLALSIIAFLVIEISGIMALGFFAYMGKFFPFTAFKHGISSGLIALFVGFIEFISEFIRLISFSFRLFGNIFAGGVLLSVAAFFFPVVLPVPFMLFEIFVAFIQAAIFSMLTLFFLKLALMEAAH